MSKYKVLFSTNAECDLDAIYQYYKNINPQIAVKFIESLQTQLTTISTFPLGFPLKHHIFRAKLIKGFPYCILYDVEDKEQTIFINRIFHTKSDISQ